MPLNKPSGNMYPWAYTWNPLAGKCDHDCGYCYVGNKIAPWLQKMGNDKYVGKCRLVESELEVELVVPEDYVIFVQSCGDLFGSWVPVYYIESVLTRLQAFPQTTFLLQTKNPSRYFSFHIPSNCILGTTIETNRMYTDTKAPQPKVRYHAMKWLSLTRKLMVSIEPIMNFDMPVLVSWIANLRPLFVSVGADSGNNSLSEPSPEKLKELLSELNLITEVRRKKNLNRLLA
jgi:protein gp37